MGLFNDMLEITKISVEAKKYVEKIAADNLSTDEDKFNAFKEYLEWLYDRVENSTLSEEMKQSFLEGAVGNIWEKIHAGTNISKDEFLKIFGDKWKKYLENV